MKILLIAFMCIPAFCLLIEDPTWHVWKKTHSKTYSDEGEERVRYVIWRENMKKIIEHNAAGKGFQLAMNHFGDMTVEEFSMKMNGFMGKANFNMTRKGSTFLAPSHVEVPTTVDWRKEGYVTPVKNQEQCGSCWAFSATGSLEGQHFKKTGKLVSLSEQNLVDCSRAYGNYGCQGGFAENAFRYIKANKGVDTEASYPYEAENGKCRFKRADVGATESGYVGITFGDEEALMMATATVGPISVSIDARHSSFQFYHSGIYDNALCSSTRLSHAVLVVGYGVHEGTDYWLVKNSWGSGWGLDGYIMMSRNKNNQCGIATRARYPLV